MDEIFALPVVEDVDEEEELLSKYRYISQSRWAHMSAAERSEYLFAGLDWFMGKDAGQYGQEMLNSLIIGIF